eukprot:764150-Hanusia_phi.AAC.3
MSKRKATEPALLTACPLTGLPINDKLPKKLKSSSQVNKKTILNVMTNRLGWTPRPQSDQWDDDTWMQEYYAQLMQRKYVDEHPQQVTTPPPPQQYPRIEDHSRTAPSRTSPAASSSIRSSTSSPKVPELRNRKRNDVPVSPPRSSKSDAPEDSSDQAAPTTRNKWSFCSALFKLMLFLLIGGVVVSLVLHSDKGIVELIGGRASDSLVKKVPTLEYLLDAWTALSKFLADFLVQMAGNVNSFFSSEAPNSSAGSPDALQIVKDSKEKPEAPRKITIKESKPAPEAPKQEKQAIPNRPATPAGSDSKAASGDAEDLPRAAKTSKKKKKSKKGNLEEGAASDAAEPNLQDNLQASHGAAAPKAESSPKDVPCAEFSLFDCRAGHGDYEGWTDADCSRQKSKCD